MRKKSHFMIGVSLVNLSVVEMRDDRFSTTPAACQSSVEKLAVGSLTKNMVDASPICLILLIHSRQILVKQTDNIGIKLKNLLT